MEGTFSVLSAPSTPVTVTFLPTYRAGVFWSLRTHESSADCKVYFGPLLIGHWVAQLGPTQRLSWITPVKRCTAVPEKHSPAAIRNRAHRRMRFYCSAHRIQ